MRRISLLCTALAVGCVTSVAASSAVRPPITQAASGKTVRLAKGENAVLRLSNRWHWSEPRLSSAAVELTPVEYFIDPGFREWTIEARKPGRATIRSLGRPRCSACALATRRFVLTLVVGTG
jgi:predicted secreted protein